MQISHVRMHAIIKERYIFPKKWNVLVSELGVGDGKRESGIQSYSVWNCPSAT